jgi:hypothetical protein
MRAGDLVVAVNGEAGSRPGMPGSATVRAESQARELAVELDREQANACTLQRDACRSEARWTPADAGQVGVSVAEQQWPARNVAHGTLWGVGGMAAGVGTDLVIDGHLPSIR